MILSITKSARQFGYIVWSSKAESEIKKLIGDSTKVYVKLNGFDLGEKPVDWKYHRISLGYKFTRALPVTATQYNLSIADGILEVTATNGDTN